MKHVTAITRQHEVPAPAQSLSTKLAAALQILTLWASIQDVLGGKDGSNT